MTTWRPGVARRLSAFWAVLTVLVLAGGLAVPGLALAQAATRPQYDIELNLDVDAARADVHQVVTYRNQTGDAFSSLVFDVTPAYYEAFALQVASVGEQKVSPTLNGTVLEVPLPVALVPGATATVTLDFVLTIPKPGNLRFGYSQRVFALGNWYPVLAVYRQGPLTYGGKLTAGWDRHQHNTPSQAANGVEPGDPFFTEAADYRVNLTLSRPLKVAHTGESLPGSTDTSLRLAATGVRDFALALSDRYESATAQVGGTTITAYYLPEHRAGGKQYLESARGLMAWANKSIGVYPYASYFVAETSSDLPDWVGQEYPGVVFISSQSTAGSVGLGSYLDYLVIHETVHQWFYALVGDDQLYEPWVDEALTTHLSYRYYEAVDANLGLATLQNLANRRRQEAAMYPDRPVNTGIYDYEDEGHYFAIVYRKGALFLEEARQLMGDAAYLAALSGYYQRFSGSIASGRDLLAALAANAGPTFRPLVARYFSYPEYQATATASSTATRATGTPAATGTAGAARATATAAATAAGAPTPSSTPTATASPTSAPTATATASAVPTPSATSTGTATPTPPVPLGAGEVALDWVREYSYLPAGVGVGVGLLLLGLAARRLRRG